MVKPFLVLILLAAGGVDAASLRAQLDRSTAALGEPLSFSVQAQGVSLDALDVAPLMADFEVFSRTLSRSTNSETLVLTLYPRKAGSLQLPALTLETRRTAAQQITVTEGSDSVPRVTATWVLEPPAPRVGEPARLSLAICDDGGLQWRRPMLPIQSGHTLRALGEEQGPTEHAGEPCTLQRFHWALLPTRAGAASIDLAMLDASRFGQRLRFPGPSITYRATALPAWLPAQVPPVAAQIVAEPLPARWPLGRPLGWRFEVSGGYSADGLKALLAPQLRDSPALGLYPPLVEVMENEDMNSPLTRHVVTLFWLPRASGDVIVPTLRLPWYDTERGRLAASVVEGKTLAVFDPRWQRARQVAGALASLVLVVASVWQLRRMLGWRLARRRGLRAIRTAGDVACLARSVRGFSLVGEDTAASLGDWQRRLRRETGEDVAAAVRQLEQQAYGLVRSDLDALKQAFLRPLSAVRPKRYRTLEDDGRSRRK
jgi:hypothetical protein